MPFETAKNAKYAKTMPRIPFAFFTYFAVFILNPSVASLVTPDITETIERTKYSIRNPLFHDVRRHRDGINYVCNWRVC
jgi:hypothetical protein